VTAAATPSPTPDPLGNAELSLLAFYNPDTGALEATTHLASVRNITFFAGGSFWSLAENPKTMWRVDPATHRLVQAVPINVVEAHGFTVDDDYVFVTDLGGPKVTRIDARTATPETFTFGNPKNPDDQAVAQDVTTGAGSVWLSRPDVNDADGNNTGEITRMNRVTGKVEARIKIKAFGLTYGSGGLWWWREGTIGRIDDTNRETFPPVELATDTWLGNIYVAGGEAWTASTSTGRVWRVDSSGRSTVYNLKPGVSEFAGTAKTMWVTNSITGQLTGIDLATGQLRTIDTGHAILGVSAGAGQLMVAVDRTVDEYIAGLDGSVLSLSTDGIPWWDPAPDPPIAGNFQARQMLDLTCAGLYGYPDEPGVQGLQLVPELADGPPTVSGDGLAYTFTIKPGFRFSPPSNEEVTADTLRYTLERAVSPIYGDDAPGPNVFADIAGVEEYREGKAPNVSGLTASGNQLTITLARPVPDLLAKLASSYACPVPLTTPALHSGLNPDPPVGGDGPYYLQQRIPRRLVIFAKNPNYHGARKQPFDYIAIRTVTSPPTAIAMVENGQLDAAMLDGGNPLTSPGSPLAADWGPASDHAAQGDERWFAGAGRGLDYIALNPNRAAFKDPDVRRAVSLALDRTALANFFTNAPTAKLLLPSVPGFDPDQGPARSNVEAAKALLKGRELQVTMLGFPTEWGCGPCTAIDAAIVEQLAAVGITVKLDPAKPDQYPGEAYDKGAEVDMYVAGMGTDLPDPAALIDGLHDVQWIGDANLAELDRLEALSGQQRVDAAAALAKRVADDEALVLPIDYGVNPMFISSRLGCGFVQPAVGTLDLLSLCVKGASSGAGSASSTASP
jgi:ABC-type transport system substrate-binding protein